MEQGSIALENLSGTQKTAILLIALGKDGAAEIFRHMKDADVERLSVEIAKIRDIPSSTVETVLEEFHQMIMAQEYISQGGIDYAQGVLEKAMGPRRASEIVSKVESAIHVSGFKLLREVDPNQLINFVQHEHPQTIALVLANLEPQQTAAIMSELTPELQADVAFRIATMSKISPELLKDVENVLENNVETVFGNNLSNTGGAKAVADILNMANRTTEKTILDTIDTRNPDLAHEIKNLMFTFDDLENLDDRSIQTVLRDVDSKILSLALKIASEGLKNKILNNMSERAASYIRQELDFMGPVRLKDVESAQRSIVELIRALEEDGIILMPSKNTEEEYIQ
ncbi:MAG: flagellar motor switch protein FliG [bacterium]|nr:flagellar motor switch protein FliG [bacterium]